MMATTIYPSNPILCTCAPSPQKKNMSKRTPRYGEEIFSNLHRFAEKYIMSDLNTEERTEAVAACFRSKKRRTQVFKEPGIATIRELISLSTLFNVHPVVLYDEYGMARGNISEGLLRILREHEEQHSPHPSNHVTHFNASPAKAEAPG